MKRMRYALLFTTVLSGSVYGQLAGDIDADFGANGFLTTDLMQGTGEVIQNMVTLPDDKIVMVGYTFPNNQDIIVARFNENGELDVTFGNNGKVQIDASLGGNDEGFGVAVLNDGKLLISGITIGGDTWDAFVLRLNSDGTMDNSFGSGGSGMTLFNAGSNTVAFCNELYVNPDNSFYAGATVQNSNGDTDFALFKFTQGGGIDNSFGSNGHFLYDYADEDQQLNAMYVNDNGNILLAGNTTDGNTYKGLIIRTSPFGTIDSGFGTAGKFVYEDGSENHYINDAIETSYGKIVAVGAQGTTNGLDGLILQLNLNGTYDNTFSNDGKQLSDVGASNSIHLWKINELNGNILTTGNVTGVSMKEVYAYMLTPSGSGVSTFSNGDVYLNSALSLNSIDMRCAALQSDGKVIIGGDVTGQDFTGNNLLATRLWTEDAVGVEELTNVYLEIYPNPAKNAFMIQSEKPIQNIVLMDQQGRVVQSWKQEEIYTIDNAVVNGNYLLIIQSEEQVSTKMLQITK